MEKICEAFRPVCKGKVFIFHTCLVELHELQAEENMTYALYL